MTLVASRCAQILNYSDLSRDIGVSVNTIRRWISVLEAAYILFILPPWYANIGKRLIKSPKVYFYDTGLVSVLTGITRFEHYNKGPMAGSLFENYIVSEIKKKSIHEGRNDPMYFFRTSHGEEIDLIIDRYPGKILIEIKKTATFRPTLVHQIEKFLKGDDTGYLLYEGEPFPYRDNLKVIPYWNYLNE
jgi:hypothetical protein